MRRYLSNQQKIKRLEGKCRFCGIDDYALLECHRIIPGNEGGTYKSKHNLIAVCSLCHTKIHAGKILILGKHFSSSGDYVVHYKDEKGIEHFN